MYSEDAGKHSGPVFGPSYTYLKSEVISTSEIANEISNFHLFVSTNILVV